MLADLPVGLDILYLGPKNKIAGINNDKWYTAGNDRRHDISVVGIYEINKNWNISGAWVFNTGQALTAPSAKYEVDGIHMFHYAERNGYRAPSYHRLDLSATYTHIGKKLTYEWSFEYIMRIQDIIHF